MAKYHVSEKGPGVCRASKRPCPLGGEEVHFSSKEAATKAFEENLAKDFGDGRVSRQGEREKLSEKLKTENEPSIDGKLAELYYKEAVAKANIASAHDAIKKNKTYMARYPEGHPNHTTYLRSTENLLKRIADEEAVAEASHKEAAPYNAEFERRKGWTRAFLVSNGNGHVHKDMQCSTCFPTTRYAWMTDYSGKSEEEIVDAAGERACTVCYPSAPVSSLNKPTKMFTEDEKKQQEAREERARVKVAKEAKAKAAGIFAEDGGPLKVKGYGSYMETVKTERSAQIMAVDILARQKLYAQWDSEGHEYNYAVKDEGKEKLAILLPALARKRGQSEDEVLEDLQKRADAKWKREYQQ